MRDLKLWEFIIDRLKDSQRVMLMCVVESEGSSPGRQGFKMAVTENDMTGSVGGGIMEHKFVEMAKEMLKEHSSAMIKKQFHQKSAAGDRSGMICSGEQTMLLYMPDIGELYAVQSIINSLNKNGQGKLTVNEKGLWFEDGVLPHQDYSFAQSSSGFTYMERTGYKNHLYIIGGGHCALALSKIMHGLNFYIHIFDHRRELNTLEVNHWAHAKNVVKDYAELKTLIPSHEDHYVCIMTFGYRTDDTAVRAIIGNSYRYLGVLGSESKMKQLFGEWLADGISSELIKKIHTPIGLKINSETPEEIAVSIAAEIISLKNKR